MIYVHCIPLSVIKVTSGKIDMNGQPALQQIPVSHLEIEKCN